MAAGTIAICFGHTSLKRVAERHTDDMTAVQPYDARRRLRHEVLEDLKPAGAWPDERLRNGSRSHLGAMGGEHTGDVIVAQLGKISVEVTNRVHRLRGNQTTDFIDLSLQRRDRLWGTHWGRDNYS